MTLDNMGSKQRAWFCAGYGSFIDADAEHTELWVFEGERPVLALCPLDAESADTTELAFGWAISDMVERRHGWMELYRRVLRLAETTAAALVGCLVLMDLNGDGVPDALDALLHTARLVAALF